MEILIPVRIHEGQVYLGGPGVPVDELLLFEVVKFKMFNTEIGLEDRIKNVVRDLFPHFLAELECPGPDEVGVKGGETVGKIILQSSVLKQIHEMVERTLKKVIKARLYNHITMCYIHLICLLKVQLR